MPLNTPDFDKIDEPQSSAGSFLNAGRGSTEIALMTKSLKSHGIDVSNLHAGSKLRVELSSYGMIFTLRINQEGLFEIVESSDNRLPIGTTYTDLTEYGFSNSKTRTGTSYIHKIEMLEE